MKFAHSPARVFIFSEENCLGQQYCIRDILGGLLVTFCLMGCGKMSGPHEPVVGSAKNPQAAEMSFSAIQPILQTRCVRCHNSGANDWTKEENLHRTALSGALAQRVGGKTMPQAGSTEAQSITQDEREALVAWANSQNKSSQGSGPSEVSTPDMIRDRNIAVMVRCTSCHGPSGTSVSLDIPNLSSHGADYFESRLESFLLADQPGTMPATLQALLKEQGIVYQIKNSTDVVLSEEAKNLFKYLKDYFTNQYVRPSADEFKAQQAKLSPEQKILFESGKKIVAEQSCTSCHLQADFRPMEGMPMIFGQKLNYLQGRWAQFRRGEGGQMMPGIAAGLSEADGNAIVMYLSNSHPTAP